MWTHSCHCVYACVRMCRWLGAGLQCLQSVSNGDAAVPCRAGDAWVRSCMHANTLHVDGLARDCDVSSASAMEMLWSCADPSTWAFKDHYMCCTPRNHYRRFDIFVVAVDTEVLEMTTFGAAGDGRDVWLALFSCMCYGHSAYVIPCPGFHVTLWRLHLAYIKQGIFKMDFMNGTDHTCISMTWGGIVVSPVRQQWKCRSLVLSHRWVHLNTFICAVHWAAIPDLHPCRRWRHGGRRNDNLWCRRWRRGCRADNI